MLVGGCGRLVGDWRCYLFSFYSPYDPEHSIDTIIDESVVVDLILYSRFPSCLVRLLHEHVKKKGGNFEQ
jgi:hypothetical protein